MTAAITFAIAWAIDSIRKVGFRDIGLALIVSTFTAFILYIVYRRQRLKYLRSQVVHHASTLISNAQHFDAAVASAITFIQEVELVSRGYSMWV